VSHQTHTVRLASPGMGDEEVAAAEAVLRSGDLVQGEQVAAFEAELAAVVGTRHAVAVSSGTAALFLSLRALGIGAGDEVIVPDFTFPATANAVEETGARAVLVDVDLKTLNIRAEAVTAAAGERTRAVMPVDLFGRPAPWGRLLPLADGLGLEVIEDSACALGAELTGRFCGSFGRMGILSFHPRKVVTTGEGGAVTTDDEELADRLRLLRNHGMQRDEDGVRFASLGMNYRLSEVQAAVGRVQLRRLPGFLARRRALAAVYNEALAGAPLLLPADPPGARHSYQAYVVVLPDTTDRRRVMQGLGARGFETAVGTYAIHSLDYYKRKCGLADGLFPDSTAAALRTLALPLHPGMTDEDAASCAAALAGAL